MCKVFVGGGFTGAFMSDVVRKVAMHKAGWNEWYSHQGCCRGGNRAFISDMVMVLATHSGME